MAADPDGVVGCGVGLPWDLPQELVHFRRTTEGQPIIMGRKTFEEMTSDQLQGRPVYVFTQKLLTRSNLEYEVFNSFYDWDVKKHMLPDAYMIGGAEIAHLFLRHQALDGFILTRIHRSYVGDVCMDLSLFEGWHTLKQGVYDDYTINYMVPPSTKGTFNDIFIRASHKT